MNVKKIIIGALIGVSSISFLNAGGVGDMNKLSYNACYTKRILPLNYDVAFESMKDLFIKTNINLVNLSKKDGFMYGKGSWKNGSSLYNLTITVNLKNQGDITNITTTASYSVMKKEFDTETGGIAGINFPMPVLWKKSYNIQDSGNIQDPNFYMGFYINYEKVIFDNLMRNGKIELDKKSIKEKPKKEIKIIKTKENNLTKIELNTTKNIEENITKIKKENNTSKIKTEKITKEETK